MTRSSLRWLALALLVLVGPVRAQPANDARIRLPAGVSPVWQAIPEGESAGDRGAQILYPAPNAGGLIAAILTHSIIVNGARDAERQRKLEQAELTLQPLRGVISSHLEGQALLMRAHEHLVQRIAAPLLPAWIEVAPSYFVLPDHRALSLDVRVSLPPQGVDGTTPQERRVRVISGPRFDADPTAHWLSSEGQALRDEASHMLAHALEIAILFGQRPPGDLPARTQRYPFGSETLMERGQAVKQGCERVLLFTLREHWMSVPKVESPDRRCDLAYKLNPD